MTKPNKLEMFDTTKKMLKYIGLLFTYSDRFGYKCYRVFALCMLTMMFQPMGLYLITYISDITKLTDASIQISAESMMTAKWIIFFYNRKSVTKLLVTLQKTVNEKMQLPERQPNFISANNEFELIVKIYIYLLIIAGIAHSGLPAATLLFNYFKGTVEPDMRRHPFTGIFLYDYISSPGYEITYMINVVYNITAILNYGAIDSFFIGSCLYVMALVKDLKWDFENLNSIVKSTCLTGNDDKIYVGKLKRNFDDCIRKHNHILSLLKLIKEINNGIIFSQFFGAIFVLSTIAFQAQMSQGQEFLAYVAPGIAVVAELFLFCFYGNKLTDETFTVINTAVYGINWYNLPVKFQKYIQISLVRMQYSGDKLNGCGFVDCSLESFTSTMKTVGSVVALFQNIQETS